MCLECAQGRLSGCIGYKVIFSPDRKVVAALGPSQRGKKFHLIFILSTVYLTKGIEETEDSQGKKKTSGEIWELYQQSPAITSRFLVTEASLVETVLGMHSRNKCNNRYHLVASFLGS